MRKIETIYKSIFLLCLAAIVVATGCKKDDTLMSKELYVYVKGDTGTTNNSIVAALTQTQTAVWGKLTFNLSVYATRNVVADVNVTIVPDSVSVARFNAYNGTKCSLLPASTYTINSQQHTITAGSTTSDPLQITITNAKALTDTNGYVLPLTIMKVDGADKGVTISSNLATSYLYIPYKYTNVDTVQIPLTGTLISRTTWSVTVSNTTSGALGPAMLDGNNTTAWRSSNTSTAAKYVILNMGSSQTVKGFQFVPDYVTTTENPTQMTVSSSADSLAWSVQGVWNGTAPLATSTATNPDIKGVNFIGPVTAKYFRFDITAIVSGSRAGIGELNAVK